MRHEASSKRRADKRAAEAADQASRDAGAPGSEGNAGQTEAVGHGGSQGPSGTAGEGAGGGGDGSGPRNEGHGDGGDARQARMVHLTGDSYFESFRPGDVLVHARGRTITDAEHVTSTCHVLNTAQIHFNQHLVENDPAMQNQSGGARLVVGTYVLAVCMGLSSQDTAENAACILSLKDAKHSAGVHPGDTLTVRTQVVAVRDARPDETARAPGLAPADAGVVTFRLEGRKQDGRTCLEATYEALVRRRPAGRAG